jgi:cytochrome c55X
LSTSRSFAPGPLAILLGCLAAAAAAEPSAARQKELIHLVRQDCGSCHGMTLQGGLGPPLLPATLADKPVDSLVATIVGGRPGTPMPPWHRFLAEDEAQWIVARLMAGFPQ